MDGKNRETGSPTSGVQGKERNGSESTEIDQKAVDEGADEATHEKSKNEGEIEEIQTGIDYGLEGLSKEIDQFLSNFDSLVNNAESHDEEHDPRSSWIEIPQFVGKFLDLSEAKIAELESGGTDTNFCDLNSVSNQEDDGLDSSLIDAIDRVSKLLNTLKESKACVEHHGPLINHTAVVHQRAMVFLEEEFHAMLEEPRFRAHAPDSATQAAETANSSKKEDHKANDHDHEQQKSEEHGEEDQTPSDESIDFPGYSRAAISKMRKITTLLENGWYGSECQEAYLIARRNMLEQALKDEGFEKASMDEVMKMNWDALEKDIPTWNHTFRDCATKYFPGERNLADEIFPKKKELGETLDLFSTITRSLMMQFLAFAEAVVMTKRAQEKLFKVLDIYETLRDYFPSMERLFPETEANELRSQVESLKSRLAETAISIFSDLETSIKSDSSKTPVPGGAIHPLTRYTMNYLKLASDYKDTLEQVFKDHRKIERANSSSRSQGNDYSQTNAGSESNDSRNEDKETGSPFSNHLTRIMDFLDANLEVKSKLYRDVALSSVFMMNNGRYIVQKIKGSPEIHEVMGDTWYRKRSSVLRNYHKNYQRETWGKLLGCLAHEGLMHNGKIVKPNLKNRFKSFNTIFDDIIKTQSSWVVNDEQLQSELRVSVTAVVIPAYRSFLGRFAQHLDPGRQTEKYIKYQPEDIEALIDELFEGNAFSSTTARRKT